MHYHSERVTGKYGNLSKVFVDKINSVETDTGDILNVNLNDAANMLAEQITLAELSDLTRASISLNIFKVVKSNDLKSNKAEVTSFEENLKACSAKLAEN